MLHLHVRFLGTCIVSVLGQDAGLLQADITLNNPLSLVAALFPSLIQLACHATNSELSLLVPERTGQHRAALRALCLISCRHSCPPSMGTEHSWTMQSFPDNTLRLWQALKRIAASFCALGCVLNRDIV